MNQSEKPPVVQQALQRVLGAFGLGTSVDVQPAGGTASPKWAVRSAGGRFLVRVRPAEFADPESIRFDHDALGRLKRAGLPVPIPLDLVRHSLDAGLYAGLPHGLIHGDFHPGNVRFRGSAVAAIYDFDYLNVQARARDVSDGLIFFAATRDAALDPDDVRSLTQPFVPDSRRSRLLLEGYQSMSLLSDPEWKALPLLIRSRWLQMRLRGSRKVPEDEKAGYVLDRFWEVIDWLDHEASGFFDDLRTAS